MFEGQFIGMHDKNNQPLHCGDRVGFRYFNPDSMGWEDVEATIIYLEEKGLFCLRWDSHKGEINRYFMNPWKYEKL